MPDVPFTSLAVDLSKQGLFPLVPPGVSCYALTVFAIPTGVQLVARDGAGNVFPLYFATQTVKFCPPVSNGLGIVVPAGLAGIFSIGVNAEQGGTPPVGTAVSPASFLGGVVQTTAGNGAGQLSVAQLINPVTSTKVLLVRACGITGSVAAQVSARVVSVLQAGNPTSSYRTATAPGMPATVSLFKAANQVVAAGGITPAGFLNVIGGSSLKAIPDPLPQALLIAPGNALECAGGLGVNGMNLIMAVAWDEA